MSSEIPLIPRIPQGLRDAATRGTLVPFVGAGASVLGGCPTWGKLADDALQKCIRADKFNFGQHEQIRHLAPRLKLSIARALEAEHSLEINYAELIEPPRYEDQANGRRVYSSLAKLAKTFVTTNYDRWLNTEIMAETPTLEGSTSAEESTSRGPRTRTLYIDTKDFTLSNLNKENSVFYIHGSVSDPSGMVMTTRDYIRQYANDRTADAEKENRLLTFLEALFQNKTVLFVGYGLEDLEIFEYVVQKAKQQSSKGTPQSRHFMLQGYFNHQYELMSSMTKYYAQSDIELLAFRRDERDWGQLIEVLV
jgi:hypothetical protein